MNGSDKTDEIDLVNVIVVFLRRKWFIAGFVIVFLALALVYTTAIKEPEYYVHAIAIPPQSYEIDAESILNPAPVNASLLFSHLKNSLYETSQDEGRETPLYSYRARAELDNMENPFLEIDITGDKAAIVKAVQSMYEIQSSYVNTLRTKNKQAYAVIQESSKESVLRYKELYENLSKILLQERENSIGLESVNLGALSELISEMHRIENIRAINKTVSLSYGGLFIVQKSKTAVKEIRIHDGNINRIGNYVGSAQSRRRRMMPVVMTFILALLLGFFIAFALEFLSRPDVRDRLRKDVKKTSAR